MMFGMRRLVALALGIGFVGSASLVFAQNKPADAKDAKPAVTAPAAPVKPAVTEPAKAAAPAAVTTPAGEAKDAAAQAVKDEKDIESKLLKLTTPEDAFVKALRTRNALIRFVAQEEAKAKQTTDENALKEIQKNIEIGGHLWHRSAA
jgi:hypothetical protein